jgi:hypothetical protein
MPLETGNTIAELNASWPLGSDPKSQGDDHLRLIKGVMQNDIVPKSTGGTFADGVKIQKDGPDCAFTATRDGINLTEIGSFGADGFVSSTGELTFSAAGATRMTADALGIDVAENLTITGTAPKLVLSNDDMVSPALSAQIEAKDMNGLLSWSMGAITGTGVVHLVNYMDGGLNIDNRFGREVRLLVSEIVKLEVTAAQIEAKVPMLLPSNGVVGSPTIEFNSASSPGLYSFDDGNAANSEVRVGINSAVALRIPVLGTLSNNAHVITRLAGDGRYTQITAMTALLDALVASAAITPAIKTDIESLMVVEP